MSAYKNIPCPVCDKKFTDKDDIVVCPDCGAPYHRECYNEKGKCIFDDLHLTGIAWTAPEEKAEENSTNTQYEIKDRECIACGALNAHSAKFCNHCGAPLVNREDNSEGFNPQNFGNNSYSSSNTQNSGFYSYGGMYGVQFDPFDPMGGVNPAENLAENITYGEASKLVQQNTRYYMPLFRRMSLTGAGKFNFSAFLFTGGWMMYRKMYKKGLIFSSIYIILTLASQLLSVMTYQKIFDAAGILGLSSVTYSEITNIVTDVVSKNPQSFFVPSLIMILLFLVRLGVMIYCGATANRSYMKHVVETIKELKSDESNTPEVYEEKIHMNGGINTIISLVLVILYLICTRLPNYFL